MVNALYPKRIDHFITTFYNLKCKMCISKIPYIKEPKHFPAEHVEREMDAVFQIFDYVDVYQFMGGEALLHPEFLRLMKKALEYSERYAPAEQLS